MRYGESKEFFLWLPPLVPVCAKGLPGLAAVVMTRTVDALIHSGGDHDIQISIFPEAIVLKA
jgi:hypothetical protein